MIKVIFECNENMNQYDEVMEFDDDITENEIEEEYKEWVLNQIGDRFCWRRA